MKILRLSVLFFLLPLFLFTLKDEIHGAYFNGHGWAHRIDNGTGAENEVVWQFYNAHTGGAVNPTIMTISMRNTSTGTVISKACAGTGTGPTGCGNPDNRRFWESDPDVSKRLTDGTWVHESYIYVSVGFLPAWNPGSSSVSYSGNIRRTQRVYLVNPTQASTPQIKVNKPATSPVTWYNFLPSVGTFFQAEGRPIFAVGGTGAPLSASTSGYLVQNSTTTASQALLGTFNYGDSSLPSGDGIKTPEVTATGPGLGGYIKYANGAESSTFTDLDFGVDDTDPVPTCSINATNLKTVGVQQHTTDETLAINIGGSDASSGVQKGELQLLLTNPIWGDSLTEAYLPNNGNYDIANSAPYNSPESNSLVYNTTTTPAPSGPRSHLFRYRLWDKSYDAAGVQSQVSAFATCTTHPVLVFPHVDLEIVNVQLYRDVARTNLVALGTALAEGDVLYPKVTFRNNNATNSVAGPFKVSFYINASNPTSGSPTPTLVSGDYTNVGPNASVDVWGPGDATSVTVPTGVSIINPNGWVDYQDAVVEDDDSDNYYNSAPGYGVSAAAWFKSGSSAATGGNIGAVNQLSISQTPPSSPQEYLTKYLTVQGSGVSQSWFAEKGRLSGYKQNLYPSVGGIYESSLLNYLTPKIQDSVSGTFDVSNDIWDNKVCGMHTGGGDTVGTSTYNLWREHGSFVIRCNDDGVLNRTWSDMGALPAQQPGNNVYINTGDVVLDGNFNCCRPQPTGTSICDSTSGCLNVFIIYGDMEVSTNATELDGVFIVGGTFRDYRESEGKIATSTLTINGAVYANQMDLGRKLSSGTATTPALAINFNPAVYFLFNQICGENPDYSLGDPLRTTCYSLGGKQLEWGEVAP